MRVHSVSWGDGQVSQALDTAVLQFTRAHTLSSVSTISSLQIIHWLTCLMLFTISVFSASLAFPEGLLSYTRIARQFTPLASDSDTASNLHFSATLPPLRFDPDLQHRDFGSVNWSRSAFRSFTSSEPHPFELLSTFARSTCSLRSSRMRVSFEVNQVTFEIRCDVPRISP